MLKIVWKRMSDRLKFRLSCLHGSHRRRSRSTTFAMFLFSGNYQNLRKSSDEFCTISVSQILFHFCDLQKGQGHGVQFLRNVVIPWLIYKSHSMYFCLI